MGSQIAIGNPPILINLRRSVRARRLSLRVSRLDGQVSLTMPHFASERQALSFAKEREGWLRDNLETVLPVRRLKIGGSLLFQGGELPIKGGAIKRARIEGEAVIVPEDDARTGARLKALLKLQARDALAQASDRYAQAVGRSYKRLSLRDTRSRWGSCTHDGGLMYSWRLIMAPQDVLEYVAAHEVAHLVEMNHSPAFWRVVEELQPDFKKHRGWLRAHGAQLHQVSFED